MSSLVRYLSQFSQSPLLQTKVPNTNQIYLEWCFEYRCVCSGGIMLQVWDALTVPFVIFSRRLRICEFLFGSPMDYWWHVARTWTYRRGTADSISRENMLLRWWRRHRDGKQYFSSTSMVTTSPAHTNSVISWWPWWLCESENHPVLLLTTKLIALWH